MKKGNIYKHTFNLTEEVYFGFISIFKDNNPLHVDDNFAKSKGFKEKVMHGNILNGYVSYFVGELLPLKNVIIQSQRINYSNPVYLLDELIFEAEVIDFFESVNVYEVSFNFKNNLGKKVAKGNIQIGII